VAACAGGIAFRRYEYGHEVNRRVHDGSETIEKFLELAVILLLGSLITLKGLRAPGVSGWALAFVLIFLIRPLAVTVSLVRSRLAWRERAFLAWFGVKGVASLNYAAIAVGAGVLSTSEESTLFWTVAVCVIVSIVVHGISATPVTRLLLDPNAGPSSGEQRQATDATPDGRGPREEALSGTAPP
jgi:NhaP-type Na+/H+ or K+/H+ antiporter